jgi:hypothetical protein
MFRVFRGHRRGLEGAMKSGRFLLAGATWALTTANFGQAIERDAYQLPRTFRFSVGLRF